MKIRYRQRLWFWCLVVAGTLLLLVSALSMAATDDTKSAPPSAAEQCLRLAATWWDDWLINFNRIDSTVAVPVCERAVRENPHNADLKAYLCFGLARAGRQQEALSWCQEAATAGSSAGKWGLNFFYDPDIESTLQRARLIAEEAKRELLDPSSQPSYRIDETYQSCTGISIMRRRICVPMPNSKLSPDSAISSHHMRKAIIVETTQQQLQMVEEAVKEQRQLATAARQQLEQELKKIQPSQKDGCSEGFIPSTIVCDRSAVVGVSDSEELPSDGVQQNSSSVPLTRYPTIETQDEVITGREFAVQVSLTEEQITSAVQIKQGTVTAEGQLALALPPDRDAWPIDVALSAEGFTFRDNRNTATLSLPRSGDSTPALFHLTPKAIDPPTLPRKLYVTFWHQGQYLAKVVRPIQVVRATDGKPSARAIQTVASVPRSAPLARPIALAEPETPVDLTVFIAGSTILLHSPHLALVNGALAPAPEKTRWLTTQFAQLSRAGRGFTPDATRDYASPKDAVIAHAKGFGKALYQEFAPAEFKAVFWRLKDQLGENFRSIQIYTDNPDLPWELMRPVRADGSDEQDFLGMSFRLARWHVSQNANVADRPPPRFPLRERLVIAPNYAGARSLPSVATEVDNLKQIGFQRVNGRFEALRELFDGDALRGDIVHFAGHGLVKEGGGGTAEYAIQLENGQELNILMWRGLTSGKGRTAHPLVFFNACDIGQAHRVANFVEGWAPTVLESGASGYIGGLWSIDDRGAADFAADFYRRLAQQLPEGPVLLADALRQTRQRFYQTGDPTFLAYVYYGDSELVLVKE